MTSHRSASPTAQDPMGHPEDGCLAELSKGRLFMDRYILIDRLTSGSNSVVWSAVERIVEHSTRTYARRAIKFLNMTVYQQEQELWVLEIIADVKKRLPSHPGAGHVLQLFDKFSIIHEDDKHLGLVVPLFSHSLDDVQAQYEDEKVPVHVVRAVSRQLLEALAFLHDECEVVHADVRSDNILFDGYSASELSDNLVLIAYNTSMPEHTEPAQETLPGSMSSPEIVAGLKLDRKTDIWSTGCLIFELLAGTQLFPSIEGSLISSAQWAYAHMLAFCKLPDEAEVELNKYFSCGTHAAELFPSGTKPLVRVDEDYWMSLEQILKRYEIYSSELLDFLQSMLRLRPEDRLSAQQLLSHPWLADQ